IGKTTVSTSSPVKTGKLVLTSSPSIRSTGGRSAEMCRSLAFFETVSSSISSISIDFLQFILNNITHLRIKCKENNPTNTTKLLIKIIFKTVQILHLLQNYTESQVWIFYFFTYA